ncbi:MAG: type IV pilus assembly protein PilV [Porticoccaceae bacterium]
MQAVLLMTDMVNRLTTNNGAAPCYITASSVYFGSNSTYAPTCSYGSIAQQASAINDLAAWDATLKGSSETLAGASVGGIIGARGCVFYDSVADAYYVTVAWQGLGLTFAPPIANSCGANLYGDELSRRVVSATVKFGALH